MINIGVYKSPTGNGVTILFQGQYFTSEKNFVKYLKETKGYSDFMSELTVNNLRPLTEEQAESILDSMQLSSKQKSSLLFRKPEGLLKKLTSFFSK